MDKAMKLVSIAGQNRGKMLVYWMQAAQRVIHNPAFDYAISRANEMRLPLVVTFVVYPDFPEANWRHYHFMLQGIHELSTELKLRGIGFRVIIGNPVEILSHICREAVELICDHGYLGIQRQWRNSLQQKLTDLGVTYTEIETEAMVPIELVSNKEEYAAATIRPKILRLLPQIRIESATPQYKGAEQKLEGLPFIMLSPNEYSLNEFIKWVKEHCVIDSAVSPVTSAIGGHKAAVALLKAFISDKLHLYYGKRNDPGVNIQSGLSPYLHFGQISPMEIVQQLMDVTGYDLPSISSMIRTKEGLDNNDAGLASYVEELIIRRELSFNFCHYNEHYDSYACLPDWVKATLANHISDAREQHYSLDRLEQCATSDVYWNAAQQEMMETGKMHNYMRMYWGKRLIAWFASPEEAYSVLLYLNNKYSLDGRDPNSFAGVAWCFGKHDRPWMNRDIYGMVRYMNMAGLNRKYDMEAYLSKVANPRRKDAK